MTEDEARTKWCPFARVVTVHAEAGMIAGPANRTEVCGEDHFTKPMGSFCIASACMAWRWSVVPVAATAAEQLVRKKGRGFETYWVAPVAETVGDGFCGLAGASQ
jgi:hypothetical protein